MDWSLTVLIGSSVSQAQQSIPSNTPLDAGSVLESIDPVTASNKHRYANSLEIWEDARCQMRRIEEPE